MKKLINGQWVEDYEADASQYGDVSSKAAPMASASVAPSSGVSELPSVSHGTPASAASAAYSPQGPMLPSARTNAQPPIKRTLAVPPVARPSSASTPDLQLIQTAPVSASVSEPLPLPSDKPLDLGLPKLGLGTLDASAAPSTVNDTAPGSALGTSGEALATQAKVDSLGKQAAIAEDLAGVRSNEAQKQVDIASEKERIISESERREQKINADADADLKARMAVYERAASEQAGRKPSEYWADKSVGQKIVAMVAVYLGGAGGGQNRALEMIQKSVADDYKRQVNEIEAGAARVAQLRGDVGLANDIRKAGMASLAAWRAGALESVAAQMETSSARSNVAEVAAKGKTAAEQLRQAAEEAKMRYFNDAQLDARKDAEIANQTALANARIAGVGGFARGRSTRGIGAGGIIPTAIYDASGEFVADLGDKVQKNNVAKSAEGYGKFSAALDALEADVRNTDVSKLGAIDKISAYRRRERLISKTMLALKEAEKMGALDIQSERVAKNLTGSALAQFAVGQSESARAVQDIRAQTRTSFQNALATHGVKVDATRFEPRASSGVSSTLEPAKAAAPSAPTASAQAAKYNDGDIKTGTLSDGSKARARYNGKTGAWEVIR